MVADLWDITFAGMGPKRPTRYPRPYKEARQKLRRGNAAGRTPEEIKAILREQFGQPEPPV